MKTRWISGFAAAALLLPTAAQAEALKPVSLSLKRAQDYAVQGNEMLAAARTGIERAKALKLQTLAGRLPSLRVSESAMRSNDAVNAFGFRLKQERFTQADFAVSALNDPAAITNFQTKLELRQPIFNGGQAVYQRAQAEAGVQASQADLRRAEDGIRFHTAEAYWGVVLANEALAAVQAGRATAESNAAATEVRHREETAPLSDLLAAQVRVSELKQDEIDARNRVAQAADGLTLVMGMDVDAQIVISDALQRPALALDLNDLVSRVLSDRPDLEAVRHRVAAAQKGIGAARASYLPHLNAFAELNLDSDKAFSRKGESWTAGAMVTWDIFSGLQTIGAVRAARAAAAGTEAQARFREEEIVREVRQAHREVLAADAQVDVAEEALGQADERLRITQLLYREGLATATDLLGAEAGQTQSKVRRLRALHALNVGLARLEFAVGSPN